MVLKNLKMNTDANITISDIISFREDLNSSWQLLQQEARPVRAAILERFKDTESRIANTTDVDALQKLDAFKKFLKSLAAESDARDLFIQRMVNNFNAIDDAYWEGVLYGQSLIEENRLLREKVESLSIQKKILNNSFKKVLAKRRERTLRKAT